ncbi:MAG: dockerin type I domain-containing protein [Rubripirellula sp.]
MSNRKLSQIQRRRVQLEALESRRLLAANCVASDPLPTDALQVVQVGGDGIDVSVAGVETVGHRTNRISDLALPAPGFGLHFGPDLVQEVGNKVFVVDQEFFHAPNSSLVVYERDADGALSTILELDIDFSVQDMLVTEDQVVLLGNNFDWTVLAAADAFVVDGRISPQFPQTLALTVNLDSAGAETGVETIRQELEGSYHNLNHDGDQLTLVSTIFSDVISHVYPPVPPSALVQSFNITSDGLQPAASGEVEHGSIHVHEDTIYSANTDYSDIVFFLPPVEDGSPDDVDGIRAPDEPWPEPITTSTLTRYGTVEGEDGNVISPTDQLDLGNGFISSFKVAEDGQTAVAVITDHSRGTGPAKSVLLIDLSGENMSVFETVALNDFEGDAFAIDSAHVIFREYSTNSLVVVDTDQSIDLAAENRVRRIEIPDALNLQYEHLQVNDDRLVVWANRVVETDDVVRPNTRLPRLPFAHVHDQFFRPDVNFWPGVSQQSVLLTFSISQGELIADTEIDSENAFYRKLISIDAESQRFGYVSDELAVDGPLFVYGHLNEEGEFLRDGALPSARWLEIDVNGDRLIARESDRIVEYDWENPSEPIETPLGELDPPIEAVNDAFTVHSGEDHLLDVLANDQLQQFRFSTNIVELIGAPEGAEIVGGHSVRIPAASLEGVENLRFEYVISDGRDSSTAVVEVDVLSISDEQVEALVEAIRVQAAEDLRVEVEDVDVTSIERVFGQPLPIVLPDGTELDLSPGILVIIQTPNATALYAASMEGEIVQAFASVREFLVELGLQAVDVNGEPLDQVAVGDEFWLEFNAHDLRDFGLGVYAAFFDLDVPSDLLEVTGPIEFGEGFTGMSGTEFGPDFMNNVGGLSDQIDPPGSTTQQILRIGVRAVGAGNLRLRPQSAGESGTEALLRGRQTEVPESRVRYTTLELEIVEGVDDEPLDSNGDGAVTAVDALVVINFLSRYGVTDLSQLAERVRSFSAEGEEMSDGEIDLMRRLDTNRSGSITALDALVVVNNINSSSLADDTDAEGEEEVAPLDVHDLGKLF